MSDKLGDDPRLGEFDVIARHFRPLAGAFPGSLDLTDDAAIIDIPSGRQMVVSADALVAGVHFIGDEPAADIAWKALAVNVSDLAAMGAEPYAYALTLAVDEGCGDQWLTSFTGGLREAQEVFGLSLLGGDTVSTPGPLTLSITAMGMVDAGRCLKRGGARPGDDVWVSGFIGEGALGLLAASGAVEPAGEDADGLMGAYRRPKPNVRIGPRLIGLASACMDVSDGLVADMGHLTKASSVGAEIHLERIPLSAAAERLINEDHELLKSAITGGDDYVLLFTAAEEARQAVIGVGAELAVSLYRIGKIIPAREPRVHVLDATGSVTQFERPGYIHF